MQNNYLSLDKYNLNPIGGEYQRTEVSSKFQRSMYPENTNARVNHSVPTTIQSQLLCQKANLNIFLKLQTPTGTFSRSLIVHEGNQIETLQQETDTGYYFVLEGKRYRMRGGMEQDYRMLNVNRRRQDYCEKCIECDRNRTYFKHNNDIQPIAANEPMEIIEIDHIGPLPETSRQECYVLTVIDLFTRKRWYIPAKSTTAKETYDLLLTFVISSFGIPRTVLTDCGTAFNNDLSKLFSTLTGIEHNYAIPNPRHESMGAVERANRSCEDMLRKFVNKFDQKDWSEYVCLLAYAENQATCRSHNFQPDFLMFAREPRRHVDFSEKFTSAQQVKIPAYAKDYVQKITDTWKVANETLDQYRNEMHVQRKKDMGRRKPTVFKIGDLVWIASPNNSISKDNSTALAPRSIGPYKIVDILARNNIQVAITPTIFKTFRPYELRIAHNQQQQLASDNTEVVTRLIGKPSEIIKIDQPPVPPRYDEEMIDPPANLNLETIVGKRIAVYWGPDDWRKCLVIGYTRTESKNLLFYDNRTSGYSVDEDFYQDPLFRTKTNKRGYVCTWKLLMPKVNAENTLTV